MQLRWLSPRRRRIFDFLGYAPLEPARSFPEILRIYRRAAGLSKKRLARLAHIDETTLGRWERNETRRPMPATVRRLRRFFKQLGMPMPKSGPAGRLSETAQGGSGCGRTGPAAARRNR